MNHQVSKCVRVGDLSPADRTKFGVADQSESEFVNIIVGNITGDTIEPIAGQVVEPMQEPATEQ